MTVLLRTMDWVLRYLARDPLTWLWVALMVSLWPIVATFSPMGLTTSQDSPVGALYEIAFWSAVVGAMVSITVLERGRWFLSPLAATVRLSAEATALATGALVVAGVALLGATLLGAPVTGRLLLATALSGAHVVAASLLLLRFRLSSATRAWSLPVTVWAIPALLSGVGAPGPQMGRILEASAHGAISYSNTGISTHFGASVLPIIGLALAAAALVRPDAIRDPG